MAKKYWIMYLFTVGHDDKIAFVGSYGIAATTLFQILSGEMEPDEGDYKWGASLPPTPIFQRIIQNILTATTRL